ncbi:MAG: ABC transporter permease [Acidobacteriota bacterium]
MIEKLVRVFRPLLRVYPRSFRRRFGDEMVEELRQSLQEAGGKGGFPALIRVWLHALIDTLRSAPSQWRRPEGRSTRRAASGNLLSSLGQDFRFALRSFRKAPGFTLMALATLALGIGANTVIFSLVNAVILRPLPYQDPDRLVSIWPTESISRGELMDLKEGLEGVLEVAGHGRRFHTLTGAGDPIELVVAEVLAHHFELLGATPALGRTLLPEDNQPGAEPVAILSHSLWQGRFGGDPAILGQAIQLDGRGAQSRLVVGIMPPDFRPLEPAALAWTPLRIDPSDEHYRSHGFIDAVGRLHSGVTLEQATQALKALMRNLRDQNVTAYSQEDIQLSNLISLHQRQVGRVRPALTALQAAIALVMLIVCVNVANLILARGFSRQSELGLRRALGASRRRLVRQLMTENGLLGLAGCLLGTGAAFLALRALVEILPSQVPRREEISIDASVLAFTLGLSLLSVLLFGLLPALRTVGKGDLGQVLSQARGSGLPSSRHRLHQGLVIAELALSLVVVVGAGLLVKSAWRIQQVDPGFSPAKVVTLRVAPPAARYGEAQQMQQYFRLVRQKVTGLPGVEAAGLIHRLPLGGGNTRTSYTVDGILPSVDEGLFIANYRIVSPGYFSTLGIPLLSGRDFADQDTDGSPAAVVINQALARKHWPGQDPVGRAISGDEGEPWRTVVGVVGDVRQHLLTMETRPEVYVPIQQAEGRAMFLLARTRSEPSAALASMRTAVWSVDAHVPLSAFQTMQEMVGASLASSRFYAWLFSSFALLALLLGAVGVYGVISYTVGRRTHEIGIRKALGAESRLLVRQNLLSSAKPLTAGILLGLAGALAATRLLSGMLFGISAADPMIFLQVTLFLAAVFLLAGYFPIRRAVSVDPVCAIRAE